MTRAFVLLTVAFGLSACATSEGSFTRAKPTIEYVTAKSPDQARACLVAATLQRRREAPAVISAEGGYRLKWPGGLWTAELVPDGTGAKVSYRRAEFATVWPDTTADDIVWSCRT